MIPLTAPERSVRSLRLVWDLWKLGVEFGLGSAVPGLWGPPGTAEAALELWERATLLRW